MGHFRQLTSRPVEEEMTEDETLSHDGAYDPLREKRFPAAQGAAATDNVR